MVKRAYVAFVTTGMFLVRMFSLLLMMLLQRHFGGAEVRPVRT